jgi:quercetin dioxygenase-like cupin family protein
MKLGAALAVSVVVPARRDRPDSNGERDGMEPVATFDLPRAQIHGDGDDAVRWQGAFVSYGGHGADQSTTIVFEIEPGERLGWHTDQTEETQYIVSGTGELHRDDGVFLVGRSASSPPRCLRRSSTT